MKLSQKIGLAALLCLSIVMFILAIDRMTGYADHPGVMDPAWSAFWIYVESCVTIIMASVRAVRPFFVNRDRGKEADEERNRVPLPMNGKRLFKRSEKLDRLGWEEMGVGFDPC